MISSWNGPAVARRRTSPTGLPPSKVTASSRPATPTNPATTSKRASCPWTITHPYEPCYNFEAGILPLDHYPITGVIWYQGESNADRVEVHEDLFPLLVDSWRNYFSQDGRSGSTPTVIPGLTGNLPFYYVQLSSLNRPSWPVFRDSQRRLLASRPGLGMAVTSDLGDPADVHYRQKRPVGERLALQALEKHYGRAVKADGPLAKEATLVGQEVSVEFYPQEALCSADGGPIVGFEVQDAADGLFHPVAAQVDRNSVILNCSAIKRPIAVRYAWQPFTRANLVNAAGLPASTFRLSVR